ncbi:glycerophosphoryl diester phosphodiesterase family domain-containing protein [Phthorimaea operculella]|nr:glycerophosphoryl diester phosphodiesterase family domain-containing protein [Phthorimaea operculella]
MYITGSTPELGEWDPTKCLEMEPDPGTDMWSRTVTIPNTCEVYYRYAICTEIEGSNQLLVQRWETNVKPRVITESMLHPGVDNFGDYDGKVKVDRGWLTVQSLLQFKFMNNPLQLKSRKAGRIMNIKVTPVKLSFGNELHVEDSSLSTDTVEHIEAPQGVKVEVATLNNELAMCYPQPQEQFGREYKPGEVLLVNIYAPNHQNLAYLVDFYSYSSRASPTDPPCHVGYTYVLPNMFKSSEGVMELPVTCNIKHRPLGTVNIEYLIVNPMANNLNTFQVSYAKHWNPMWTGLEVGHRGLGASFKAKGHAIRENTVASLKKAAASGADLLEFDVQLSKDMIPVIYHDYHVCISMKRKKEVQFSDMLELPVKDLTLEHLQKLKVYHLVEGRSNETMFNDEDLEEHQPFPTLQVLMKAIDDHVGFNVELKWNMQLDDGTFELNNPFDMNVYVDKVLEVVLKYAEGRRIVFSCFNPDICTMVRNKQNKYPVMFLTQGVTKKYQPYRDPRCLSIPAAVHSAVSSDILGIVVHTEDLLRDPTQVKLVTDAGLVIFCWGDENNDKNTIKRLKLMGLHAVIYDKLDQYTTKEVKENVFMVEARESQKELIRLAALEEKPASTEVSASTLVTTGTGGSEGTATPPRPFLDLDVRNKLDEASTVTSLESLASVADPAEDRRKRNLIDCIDKESQVKEQINTFKGLFPAGDTVVPKKRRTTCDDL